MRSISLSFLQFWDDVKRLLRLQLQQGLIQLKFPFFFFLLLLFFFLVHFQSPPLCSSVSVQLILSLSIHTHIHTQTDAGIGTWAELYRVESIVFVGCGRSACWCVVDNEKKKNSTNRQLYTFDGCIIKCPSSSPSFSCNNSRSRCTARSSPSSHRQRIARALRLLSLMNQSSSKYSAHQAWWRWCIVIIH